MWSLGDTFTRGMTRYMCRKKLCSFERNALESSACTRAARSVVLDRGFGIRHFLLH